MEDRAFYGNLRKGFAPAPSGPLDESPNWRPLFVVADEVSGLTTVYGIAEAA